MEPHLGSQTARFCRSRLQGSVVGRPPGLRTRPRSGLCTASQVAPQGKAAFLPGPGHAPATGNGTTPRITRAFRPAYLSADTHCRRCRLKNVETPGPGLPDPGRAPPTAFFAGHPNTVAPCELMSQIIAISTLRHQTKCSSFGCGRHPHARVVDDVLLSGASFKIVHWCSALASQQK